MIARLICWWKGHKRGKLIRKSNSTTHGKVIKDYECPRCRAQWAREVKSNGEKQ